MENNPFKNEQLTEHEILRNLWGLMTDYTKQLDSILTEARKTNGRLQKLERFMWLVTGAAGVITAVIVPLFIDLIRRSAT